MVIIAGGWDGTNSHSSTEKLLVGSSAWVTIKPLPRYLGKAKALNLGNKIYLLGKDLLENFSYMIPMVSSY